MASIFNRIAQFTGLKKKESKILILGLDAAGKTSLIYKLKLGEVVTTIPTIGFNLETVDYKDLHFSIWDVGGCSKIGAIYKHFMTGTDAMIWMVDANDRDRLQDSVMEILWFCGNLPKNIPILVLCNKMDLPNCMSVTEVRSGFEEKISKEDFRWHFQGTSVILGDGMYEGMDWISQAISGEVKTSNSPSKPPTESKSNSKSSSSDQKIDLAPNKAPKLDASMASSNSLPPSNENPYPSSIADKIPPAPTTVPVSPSDSLSDDDFLKALEDCTLETWDHKTHLRIAFLYLTRLGRREGLKKVRSSIQNYIANSGRTNKTWHETMTYFWVQMVDFARMQMKEEDKKDFEKLLEKNIHLVNGSLFLQYYTRELILLNQDARKEFVLPDIKPLPSIAHS